MNLFLKSTILFVFIGIWNISSGQFLTHYQPIKIDTNNVEVVKFIKANFQVNKDTIASKDTTIRGLVIRQCETRVDLVTDFIKDGDLFQNSEFDSLVKKVTSVIVAANPIFKDKIVVLTSRSLIPNAFNLGNGIIVINMGLLFQLQSEEQLALILCHEMAHDYFRHVDNAIYSYALKSTDKELKRKIRKTLRERYNVNKKLEALLIPGVLEDMKYSRMDELLADSVGLNLLANTTYDLNKAITVIEILDNADVEIKKDPIDLKKYFTVDSVPVRSSWFDYEEVSPLIISEEDESEKELENALKTHPDCKLRKEKLTEQLKAMNKWVAEQKSLNNQYLFQNRKIVNFEIAQTMYDQLKISSCIYFILAKLELYPNDYFLKSLLSQCLATYSEYQKKRNASVVIGYNNSEYSENFNRVISFLNSISPKESSALSYWLIRPEQNSFRSNESYFSALLLSCYAFEKEDEYKKLRNEYNSTFQSGRLREYINNLPRY